LRAVREAAEAKLTMIRSLDLGRKLFLFAGIFFIALGLTGCDDNDPLVDEDPGPGDPTDSFPESDHPHVALKDRAGNHLLAGSTEPYSPRTTCGGCHDFDEVVKGYHFHQGRTDSDGNFIMTDDYFEDGRNFLQSPGMYGKW
jgi:hypothetical protein